MEKEQEFLLTKMRLETFSRLNLTPLINYYQYRYEGTIEQTKTYSALRRKSKETWS